jgi:glycosyltransferase involved in cell wall biosynthesis
MYRQYGKWVAMAGNAVVSIIVPSYNRAEHLTRAIKSIESQNFDDYEVLIVDDRSTDGTEELTGGLRQLNPRIRYFRNEYAQGPAGARNFGIDHATGTYIALLDSDDAWLEGHLLRGLNFLERHLDVDVFFGNKVVHNMVTQKVVDFFSYTGVLKHVECTEAEKDIFVITQSLLEAFVHVHATVTSATIVRRNKLGDIRFNEELRLGEDLDFYLRLYAVAGAVFAFSTVPSVDHYRHRDNISLPTTETKLMYCRNHIRIFSDFVENYNITPRETSEIMLFLKEERRRLIYFLRHTGQYSEAFRSLKQNRSDYSKRFVAMEAVKTLLAPVAKMIRPKQATTPASL